MDYTPEQRAIIARIGDISARYHDTVRRHQVAQTEAGQRMLDAVSALTAVMERSNELTTLFLEHGDAFREFLDSL
jgi:hypothetical protein